MTPSLIALGRVYDDMVANANLERRRLRVLDEIERKARICAAAEGIDFDRVEHPGRRSPFPSVRDLWVDYDNA